MRQATVKKLGHGIEKWNLKVRINPPVPEKTHPDHLDNIRETILPWAFEAFHSWFRAWEEWVGSELQKDHLEPILPGVKTGSPVSPKTKSPRL